MLSYRKEKVAKKMESRFAKNFKALRKERNMTQAEMGEILNISSMTVRRWENGSREPKMSTIEKIVTAAPPQNSKEARHLGTIISKAKQLSHEGNILTKAANKARFIHSEFMERMILCMSTYEEFMIILTTSLLIVAILNLHKKK